jgi:hypothetical protein
MGILILRLVFPAMVSSLTIGDSVFLKVPDISYFPNEFEEHQFTCRAVTENAYWLVQDTTWFDLPSPDDDFQLIWGNLVTQECIDSISAQFEGADVNVFETLTNALGPVPETGSGDDRVWVVFADIPDYYPVPGTGYNRLRNWVYTWPADFDGDPMTGNNHDIFYVNLSPYKNQTGGQWDALRGTIYTWSVASGLSQMIRVASNPDEEKWLVRGFGAYGQHLCYGVTSALNGAIGILGYLEDFAKAGGIELTSWISGKSAKDFSANIGGEFLWLKYLEQMYGSGVIEAVAQSDETGMAGIALAINPSLPPEEAMETIMYPLYEDWMITNLISPFAEDFLQGQFHYAFLDGSGYEFTIIDRPASFLAEFDSYPIPTWIAPYQYGMSAQEFTSQYSDFQGDYTSGGNTTVYFNGMFNQNNGSGPNLDGRWVVYRIVLSNDSTLQSVDSLEFNDLFNGTFELAGHRTFLALTCNNPGGTAYIRYVLSQDSALRSVFTAITQNEMSPGYMQIYTSLFREDTQVPYGFDWVGPNVELSLLNTSGQPDTTATVSMEPLAGTIWTGGVHAWSAGEYQLVCSGYDSLGIHWSDTSLCSVGFTGGGTTLLNLGAVQLTVPENEHPSGTMITLCETSVPMGLESISGYLVQQGPVSVYPGTGTLSFQTTSERGVVCMLNGDSWEEMESFSVPGVIRAVISQPGIYALCQTDGSSSPEIPDYPSIAGTYPNPFSESVSLAYSLPETTTAKLCIYDLTGRVAVTLLDQQVQAGPHTLEWDGRDRSGQSVPSGIYFAVLSSDGTQVVCKIIRAGGNR